MPARILIAGERAGFPNYEAAVAAAGGTPVFSAADGALCDGLLLPGGGDIDPARFGQENRGSEEIDPARDALELGLFRRYAAAARPILGICRGHQLINVALGGSLIQHIGEGTRTHTHADGQDRVHETRAAAAGFLAALYGTRPCVNSAHHQALDRLGEGLVPLQWTPDGVVECIAHRELPILGVQWHPERMCFSRRRTDTVDGAPLFRYFLGLCDGR